MTHLIAAFEPPTTKDFVWAPWGPTFHVFGFSLYFNFITFLVLLGMAMFMAFFFFALRKPTLVPGKLQSLAEVGIAFVRENIALTMIGPAAAEGFMPLLCTLFFAILFWNIFEIAPLINFSSNSRLVFPLIMALTAWVVFNTVGIKKHGFVGYTKHVLFPPGVPGWLKAPMAVIEFITKIIIRPITLTVRLWANFLAGHFLLAVFFLGTIAMLQGGLLVIAAPFAFAFSVVLVGFEIFVSLLQAFIFAILTASYIGEALAEEH